MGFMAKVRIRKPVSSGPRRAEPLPLSSAEIVSRITKAIFEHRLPPGTRLGEENLADVFSVSRTKIREALLHLSRDKLVTWAQGRGASVAEPSVQEARQVFDARSVLEAALIARCAIAATPEQIKHLRAQCAAEREHVAANDLQTGTPAGTQFLREFHLLIAEMSGNEVMAEMLREITARSCLIEVIYGTTMSAVCASGEHAKLLACIEKRDPDRAARLMRQHIEHIQSSLVLREKLVEFTDLKSALTG
jgi:DNA-binding GntR family transcriptional regulator